MPTTTQHGVPYRLRGLLGHVQMLIGTLPDLRDAFDPDELPLRFILRRDSRRSEPVVGGLKPTPALTRGAVKRGTAPYGSGRRSGYRKQISDE